MDTWLNIQGGKKMTVNETEIEVRYQETDQMGIVYHANYLIWFEIGRTKLIEQLGFQYASLEMEDILSPVVDVHVTYTKPALYGDIVKVHTWIDTYDGVRTTYAYKILNQNDEILVTGETMHVIVKKGSFKPVRLRNVRRDWHDAYKKEIEDVK